MSGVVRMKKWIYIALSIALAVVATIGGYFVGRSAVEPVIGTTLYADIDEIDGSALLVSGLAVNDINSRGAFHFTVEDTTVLEWRNTPIKLTDLEEGDRISVTYTGAVTETYPAGLEKVVKVQLLEDEI